MDPTDQRTASIGLGDEAVAGVAEDYLPDDGWMVVDVPTGCTSTLKDQRGSN